MILKNKHLVYGLITLILIPFQAFAAGVFTLPTNSYSPTSFFDHDDPNYVADDNFVRYDGEDWTDGSADLANCDLGDNC